MKKQNELNLYSFLKNKVVLNELAAVHAEFLHFCYRNHSEFLFSCFIIPHLSYRLWVIEWAHTKLPWNFLCSPKPICFTVISSLTWFPCGSPIFQKAMCDHISRRLKAPAFILSFIYKLFHWDLTRVRMITYLVNIWRQTELWRKCFITQQQRIWENWGGGTVGESQGWCLLDDSEIKYGLIKRKMKNMPSMLLKY